MLRAARPHARFMESRNRRVFVAQIPLIRTIGSLLSVPLRFLDIVLDCISSHTSYGSKELAT